MDSVANCSHHPHPSSLDAHPSAHPKSFDQGELSAKTARVAHPYLCGGGHPARVAHPHPGGGHPHPRVTSRLFAEVHPA